MTTTLSDEIRTCRYGAISNPFQGSDKKVLFVCSMGILRSATGSRIYGGKYNTRCAGTYNEALIQTSTSLYQWADEIVFVNKENFNADNKLFNDIFETKPIKVLDIPDVYEHMHPMIIKAYEEQYEPL